MTLDIGQAYLNVAGLKVMTLDIGQAYLNAEITEETVILKLDHEVIQLLKIVDPDLIRFHYYTIPSVSNKHP